MPGTNQRAGRLRCSAARRRALSLLPGAILLGALPLQAASARPTQDGQLWLGAAASGPVRGELGLFLFAETRLGDDMSRLSQTLVAAGLGWEPGGGRSIYGGYLLVNTYPGSEKVQREHRLWQQAAYPLAEIGAARVSGRSLLEQRHFEGFEDIGFRFQQNVRAVLPVDRRSRFKLVAYGDLMLNLNGTDWGARQGVDQVRFFGGANVLVTKSASLEIGYFRQHVLQPTAEDHINHVGLVTLFHRFGR